MCILGGLWGTIRETRRAENPEDLQSTKKTWKFRRLTKDFTSRLSSPPQWCWTCQRSLAAWPGPRSLLDDHCRTTHDAHIALCAGGILKGTFYILSAITVVRAQYFCAPWKLEIYIYDQCRRPFIDEKDHLAGWLTINTEPTIINIFFNDLFKLYPNNGRSACWYWFLMAFQTVGRYFVMLGLGSVPELLCICPCLCLPWMSKSKGCWCIN